MDKQTLEAVAGWTLTRPEPECATLRDAATACIHLAPTRCIAEHSAPQPVELPHIVVYSSPTKAQSLDESRVTTRTNPVGACEHRFHIKTQLCVNCGLSYREAKGRLPELM